MAEAERQVVLRPEAAGRHEAKYLVNEDVAHAIASFALPWVQPDPYTVGPRASYEIRSLYFDSPDFRLYRSTMDGLAERYKLRVRRYPGCPIYFLECKRKNRDLILKSRRKLVVPSMQDVVAWLGKAQLDDSEYVAQATRIGAQPVLDVGYERQAYVGAYHLGTRLTFDRQLCFAGVEDLEIGDAAKDWRPVGVDGVVLELKFFRGMPGWMQEIVRRFGLRRCSFSKYCLAVQAWRRGTPLFSR